jgi:ABC-2 type transport system ATP-binding protein
MCSLQLEEKSPQHKESMMIQVTGLSKIFQVQEKKAGWRSSLRSLFYRSMIEKKALIDIDLTVKKGEILGLLGANGAGKTTLVKCLSGIIKPTAGTISVLGQNPWERSISFRKSLALVMGQKAQLWWDIPAEDSFLLLREIYQVPQGQYRDDLDYLLGVLDARSHLRVPLRRLSLGERMKMELIAALLHRPQVIYLDEPTIGLDFTSQKSIRKFILDYRARYEPIMILTSHYMEDIESLCERIVILSGGQKIYDGPLTKVLGQFHEYKIVHIHLQETLDKGSRLLQDFLVKYGHLIHSHIDQGNQLMLQIKTSELPQIIPHLFVSFPIQDLSLSGMDITEQIERMMSSNSHHKIS